jgi:hypothetical protein
MKPRTAKLFFVLSLVIVAAEIALLFKIAL